MKDSRIGAGPRRAAAAILPMAALALLLGCTSPTEDAPTEPGTVEPGMAELPEIAGSLPGDASSTTREVAASDRQIEPKYRGVQPLREQMAATSQLAGRNANVSAAPMSLMMIEEPPNNCCWHDFGDEQDRDNYAHVDDNPVKLVSAAPVSTFSIDVDTGSYSNVRRILNSGVLPPQDAVRVEELINYFSYAYPQPDTADMPFAVATDVAPAPWNAERLLLQIGIKGYEVPAAMRKPANLVFLIDVSGSMNASDKLPLLKNSMKILNRQLTAADRVSIVVYAGASGVVLEPTPGNEHAKISRALDNLAAGGSTNGASGIRLAYSMAEQAYIPGGINRVMLATDGDFNVGTVNFDALIDIVERARENGVSLTTLGFGTGNYNDHLTEQLADAGNGNYAYIDTLNEGRKVLVDQLGSTLQTIAKDVKIQVEFNPEVVAEYRLIGYENRMLRREDFNNDRVDAGEIGAGHTVTALYELTLNDSAGRLIDPLRYGDASTTRTKIVSGAELALVRLRHKAPDGDQSRLIEQIVRQPDTGALAKVGEELRFAAAVAAFGQLLKGGVYTGDYTFTDVIQLATSARGRDEFGYRSEFLGLVRLADSLTISQAGAAEARPQTLGRTLH